jgi:GT2 family glycosyltransferase
MWLQHYFSAFRYSEGKPRLVIDYDLLLSDPEVQVRRLASFLHVPVDQNVEDRIKEYSEVFLGPNLCHYDFDSKVMEETMAPVSGLGEFYEWALDFARDAVPVEKPGEKCLLDRVNESLQSWSGFFGLLDTLYLQTQQYKEENSKLSPTVSRLFEFLNWPRGRILLSLRLLPRWMERLHRDAKGKGPAAGPLKRVYGYLRPRLYSLTLPSRVEYEQPLEQKEATREFSVVVPVHDAPEVIGRCFLSLERYAPKAQIILVDDGSKMQQTRNLIDDYADRNSWKLIRYPESEGHSRACESGAREATRRFLCLLNSDTVVTPWSWSAVLAAFEADETIGVAGPSTSWAINEQMIPIASECRHLWTDGQIFSYALRYTSSQSPESWVDLPEDAIGFAFFIRRGLWEQLGGFNIGLPDYGNEYDLCMRAKQRGYRVVWVKGSYIHHFGRMSYSGLGEQEERKKRMRGAQFAAKRWGRSVPWKS